LAQIRRTSAESLAMVPLKDAGSKITARSRVNSRAVRLREGGN
jgi:hypothetical protein